MPEGRGAGRDLSPRTAGAPALPERGPGAAALTFEAGGADGGHGGAGGLGEALEGRLLVGRLVRGGVFLLLPLVVHPHGLQGQLLPAGTRTRWARGPQHPPRGFPPPPGPPIPSRVPIWGWLGQGN